MVQVKLKDGSIRPVESGSTLMDVAKQISGRLAKEAMNAKVDGIEVDLSYVLEGDREVEVQIFKFEDEPGANAFRHTTSHIMAQAIKRL
ncbi:MAG: TGS domain-containing protein, partial [Bacillota bacterium]|nr:TGS domain-containing protein [Bacillota bacterium]